MITTEDHGELLVVVLDSDGRPFSVATQEDGCHSHYVFEWCKAHGDLYYHLAGFGRPPFAEGGRDDRWWARADLREEVHVAGVLHANRLKELPPERRDPFDGAKEANGFSCELCNDWFPDDDLCEHIWWCQECQWWTTPSDPCPHREGVPAE